MGGEDRTVIKKEFSKTRVVLHVKRSPSCAVPLSSRRYEICFSPDLGNLVLLFFFNKVYGEECLTEDKLCRQDKLHFV